MEGLLDFARGPGFLFAFAFMVLGLLRHLLLTTWHIVRTYSRAGDKSLPYSTIALSSLEWMFPIRKLRDQPVFSLTSIIFHLAVIIVPVFLRGHIELWQRGIGVTWSGISNSLADTLTVVAIVTGSALLLQRIAAKATRSLSRFQDYALPILITVPFVTGYLMMHPTINPLPYTLTFLTHLVSANLLFILVPLTKLSHMALLPGSQLVSELGWHWPRDAGSLIAASLGKEKAPV
jgi:nitrate reductase gamma subunit